MATQHSANVYITNNTDGTAYIKLFHQNDSDGTQNGSWTASPGQTVGPMTVLFETGWGSYGILDWWSVIIAVEGGSTPTKVSPTMSAAPRRRPCRPTPVTNSRTSSNSWAGREAPGFGFAYPHGSIYDALSGAGLTWRIYNDDTNAYSDDPQNGSVFGAIPQVSALKGVTLLDANSLTHFAADLQSPYTYQYTFIEPNYGDITSTYAGGSSQHPMDDVYGGEGLIKAVYEAIRNSPVWDTSLLIITYDEHGGFYDSVAPPAATPPDDGSPSTYNQWGFTFNQLGVRVPAVVVSPWIAAQTVDHTVYDHSSVPATVERLFGLSALTARDAAASDVTALFTEAQPRTDAPTTLNNPAPPAARAAIAPDTAQALLSEPIPESGNLPGFLQIALKTDLELSRTAQERDQALARQAAVTTLGDARSYVNYVMAKAHAAKTASTPSVATPSGPIA